VCRRVRAQLLAASGTVEAPAHLFAKLPLTGVGWEENLCSEFLRVPYRKRYQQPCDGRSVLATAPCEPGDEVVGEWSRDRLVRMDARFVDAVERAIARGKERPKDEPRA